MSDSSSYFRITTVTEKSKRYISHTCPRLALCVLSSRRSQPDPPHAVPPAPERCGAPAAPGRGQGSSRRTARAVRGRSSPTAAAPCCRGPGRALPAASPAPAPPLRARRRRGPSGPLLSSLLPLRSFCRQAPPRAAKQRAAAKPAVVTPAPASFKPRP